MASCSGSRTWTRLACPWLVNGQSHIWLNEAFASPDRNSCLMPLPTLSKCCHPGGGRSICMLNRGFSVSVCLSLSRAPFVSLCACFFPKALRRVLPCGALGQLAQSSLHRVTSMEISGALGQLAQSSLHRVTSMEIPAWRYSRRVTSTE